MIRASGIVVLLSSCALMFGCALISGCATAGHDPYAPVEPEARGLGGREFRAPQIPSERQRELDLAVSESRAARDAHPADPDTILWLGRRLAYAYHYREAIAVFTEGIQQFPNDARFYRHRGHRYITTRNYDAAVRDLETAARLIEGKSDEPEPPGTPLAPGAPITTLHHSIYYHLGLARLLRGENELAADAYKKCLAVSRDADAICGVSHWYYITLRRLNRRAEADALLEPITAQMPIFESKGYHFLLLVYKGDRKYDDFERRADPTGASVGYGVGNWFRMDPRHEQLGRAILEGLLQGDQWFTFGFIAAEADFKREEIAIPSPGK